MKLSWSYIGAFLDGEGCVGLYIYKGGYRKTFTIRPAIQLTCFNELHNRNIIFFIKNYEINSHLIIEHDKIKGVSINEWKSISKFIDEVISNTILKTQELILLREAYNIHKKFDGKRNSLQEHIGELVSISEKLHNLKVEKDNIKGNRPIVTKIFK